MSDSPPSAPPQETLQARSRQLDAVHAISRHLSSTLDLDERLRDILNVSMKAVNAAAGSILLHRPDDDKLVFRCVVGPRAAELTGFAMSAAEGVAGAVFRSGEPDVNNHPRETAAHRQDVGEKIGYITENIVTVPLKYQAGRPVGVMQILNKQGGNFDGNDLEVLEIVASIAAAAIENAQLHRDAQLAAVAHAVGDLSHDIKNKVTPISMSVETLRPMMEGLLEAVDRAAQSLPEGEASALQSEAALLKDFYPESFAIIGDQVQSIQEYTRMIADAIKGIVSEPQLEAHDPAHVVTRQIEALEPIARSRGVMLACDLEAGPRCRFDRFLIERAVYNLINNAIPETPAGGTVTVRMRREPDARLPEGSCLLIEVADTGRGMPSDVLERILRGDARSTKPGGTGLGTRIVRNAAAAHRGLFEGESREGVGTTFRLRIPLVPA